MFFDLALAGKRSFDAIVERLTAESGVDPEYDLHGVLYVAFDEATRAELQSRARWQRAAGGEAEELSPREAFRLAPVLSEKIIFALHMPNNRRVENRKLTLAYINAATNAGADFREGACVDSVACSGARATGLRLADGSSRPATSLSTQPARGRVRFAASKTIVSTSTRCAARSWPLTRGRAWLGLRCSRAAESWCRGATGGCWPALSSRTLASTSPSRWTGWNAFCARCVRWFRRSLRFPFAKRGQVCVPLATICSPC